MFFSWFFPACRPSLLASAPQSPFSSFFFFFGWCVDAQDKRTNPAPARWCVFRPKTEWAFYHLIVAFSHSWSFLLFFVTFTFLGVSIFFLLFSRCFVFLFYYCLINFVYSVLLLFFFCLSFDFPPLCYAFRRPYARFYFDVWCLSPFHLQTQTVHIISA